MKNSEIKNLVNDILAVGWRTKDSETVAEEASEVFENHNYPELTVDDLKSAGVGDAMIVDYMQTREIYLVHSMI